MGGQFWQLSYPPARSITIVSKTIENDTIITLIWSQLAILFNILLLAHIFGGTKNYSTNNGGLVLVAFLSSCQIHHNFCSKIDNNTTITLVWSQQAILFNILLLEYDITIFGSGKSGRYMTMKTSERKEKMQQSTSIE